MLGYNYGIVSYHPQCAIESECMGDCAPQQISGFEPIGNGISCNNNYFSEHRAGSPKECAYYCDEDLFNNCNYFMWDPSREGIDSNCIIFNNTPLGCSRLIDTYPASRRSTLYKKI